MIDSSPEESNQTLPVASPLGASPSALSMARAPLGGGGEPSADLNLSRYVAAIRRQWWLILLVVFVGTSAGVFVSGRISTLYEAEAKIIISSPQNISPANSVGGEAVFRSNSSWDGLIRSHPVVDPVVRQLSLYLFRAPSDSGLFRSFVTNDSTLVPGTYRLEVDSSRNSYTLTLVERRTVVEHGTVGDSIGRRLGFYWMPPAAAFSPKQVVSFRVVTSQMAYANLLGSLRTGISEQSQFMSMRLTGADPIRIAAAVNALGNQLVLVARDIKRARLVDTKKIIADQLAQSALELNRDEEQLRAFKESTIMLPSDAGGGPATPGGTAALLQQQLELDDVVRTRLAVEKLLRETQDSLFRPERFYTVPSVLAAWPPLKKAVEDLVTQQGDIAAKRMVFKDDNDQLAPVIRTARVLARETIPGLTNEVLTTLRQREAQLTETVDAQKKALHEIPARMITAQRLANKAAASQSIYSSLQSRNDAIRLIDAETVPDLTFFDSTAPLAVPRSSDGLRLILMALMASIAAGIGLALLRDRIDRRFRYPEQATLDLGLTILGTVPRLRFDRRGGLSVTATSQLVESFRTLRLSSRTFFPRQGPVVFCVSSAGPGEGKSLVSSNIAVAFANAGSKTLLIDGDVRRGVVHATFDVTRRPGLVDYLGNGASLAPMLQPTSIENLSVLASGSRSRKAPELLASEKMVALIAELRGSYEVIIVDSAPFAAGMDAYALAVATGAMLVVLRPGLTDRKLTAAKLEVLDRLPVSVLGAVVNGIAHDATYKYYRYDDAYATDENLKEEFDDEDPGRIPDPSPPRLMGRK